jgi:hypothetical protein
MQLFISDSSLVWGELDLPLLGIHSDWCGAPLSPPLAYSLAMDPTHLWFLATREAAADTAPHAEPHAFTPGLWHHDVAELFLADPASGRYLEFNLAANGAWWTAGFSSTRIPARETPNFENHVITHCDEETTGRWLAAMAVPIPFLKETIGFGLRTTANAAFILNSPDQTFHSVHTLGGEVPDFHRPHEFPRLSPVKLPRK